MELSRPQIRRRLPQSRPPRRAAPAVGPRGRAHSRRPPALLLPLRHPPNITDIISGIYVPIWRPSDTPGRAERARSTQLSPVRPHPRSGVGPTPSPVHRVARLLHTFPFGFPPTRVGAAPSLTLGPPGGPDPDRLADGWQAPAGGRSTPRRPPCTPQATPPTAARGLRAMSGKDRN